MKKPRKVNEEMIATVQRLDDAALKQTEIAKILGLSSATVSKIVKSGFSLEQYRRNNVKSNIAYESSRGSMMVRLGQLDGAVERLKVIIDEIRAMDTYSVAEPKRDYKLTEYNKFVSEKSKEGYTLWETAQMWTEEKKKRKDATNRKYAWLYGKKLK